MRLLILANTESRGYHVRFRRRLLNRFAKKRKAKLVFLPKTKDMFEPLKDIIKDYKHIFIAGGDGSFESALNNKLLAKKSIGFFPLGAGNAFYWYFYKGKRFVYLREKFPFHETLIDVLELTWDNGKRETMMLGAGIDAEFFRISKRTKGHPFMDYIGGAVRTFFKGKSKFSFNISVDNKKYTWKNTINIILAKTPRICYGVRTISGVIEPCDGYVYGEATVNPDSFMSNRFLRLETLVAKRIWQKKDVLVPIKGKKITVTSKKPFPIQAGGEFLGFTKKITVKVKRQQKILVI